ncbi:MAG: DUF4830 domain-containing protein [Clostridia bacterium]|nr:DUF4830 domain-containing protein [Clostridia bacterium]
MFFITVRASTVKFCATLLLGVLLVTGLVFALPDGEALDAGSMGTVRYDGIEKYEDMVRFLKEFGWQTSKEPISDETVVLPQSMEGVFAAYNDLQKKQGLDLSAYAGKKVRKVVFSVTNYEDEGQVLATLFIYRGCVVGGDLSSGDPKGFVCGFDGEKS